jgi:acetate kinase
VGIAGKLQSHPLFATFSPDALSQAARAGTVTTYEPGDVCIRQGEAGEVFGVLLSGRLEVVGDHDTPHRRRLGEIRPGECFGEMSLLTGNPTIAEIIALEKSQAVVFLQEEISPVIATNPDAVRFLTRMIAARLAPPAGGSSRP